MATLTKRIASFFRRDKPSPDTTSEMAQPSQAPINLGEMFRAERERRALVDVCNEMYDTDPRCEGAIDTLSRDIVRGGVTVKVANNPQAEEVAAALMERIITDKLDDWVKETLIEGDSFLELSINAVPEIAAVTRKPTLNMHRNSDKTDRFVDPLHAFWYDERSFGFPQPTADSIWFAEWQIVHGRWNHRSKRRYGRPLFASSNGAWKRVREGETDISIRRKTRAGMRYLHIVEGADDAGLLEYQERNRTALDNPFAASIDFFSNKPGAITTIQGDAKLADIQDVQHHIETWWTASPVPMALIGYGEALNRDILEQKLEQYKDALDALTQWAEDEFVQPLVEREWLLHGIYPQSLEVEYAWKSKTSTTARDLKSIADAVLVFRTLGFTDEVIRAIIARYLPWLDFEALEAQATATAAKAPAIEPSGNGKTPVTKADEEIARLMLTAAHLGVGV